MYQRTQKMYKKNNFFTQIRKDNVFIYTLEGMFIYILVKL